jgi:hypothetical protein
MITIAKNSKYELSVNPEKNRAYLTIFGFWRNKEEVSDYISDWKKALTHLKRGFTLLTDASEMKIHPQDVKNLHQEAQELITKAGVKQVAEVLKDAFSTAQLNKVAADSTMPKKNFASREEAENFLDTI